MERHHWHETVSTRSRQNRPVTLRCNKLVIHLVQRVAHRADLSELAIKQLERRQQPVPCKRHHSKIRKDVGEIPPSRCEQQHSHNETAESEWLYTRSKPLHKHRHPAS